MGIVNISGISDSRSAPICRDILKDREQGLIITPSYTGARRLASDLSFFVPDKKIYFVPADEETFVTYEAKNRDTLMEQLRILKAVSDGEACIVICPVSVAVKKLVPCSVFRNSAVRLARGRDTDQEKLANDLIDMGYERVPMVYAKGQFSMRGEIIDIFTPYNDLPYRVEMFDTEIEELRTFDPDTQRSIERLDSAEIFPAELLVREEEAFDRARKHISRAYKDLPERKDFLLDSLDSLTNMQLMEYYMDYFYREPEYIRDYMPDAAVIVDDPNRACENVEERNKEFKEDFEVFLEEGKVVASDKNNFPGKKDYFRLYEGDAVYFCTPFPRAVKGVEKFDELHSVQSRQTLSYNGKMDMLEKDIHRLLYNKYKVTIVCSTQERYDNMQEFLSRAGVSDRVWLRKGDLTAGMDFPEEKKCYITDGDIFGTHKKKSVRPRSSTKKGEPIKSFADIRKGDLVVHESHGIGKFAGIEQLRVKGEKKDYLKLKYAGNDLLYVPVEQMDMVQRYVGSDTESTKMNRLSGTEWRTTKAKAKASIASMAQDLLDITAARKAAPGHKFGPDTVWQKEFEDSFPYEETADQLRCIKEIKEDMESTMPMDRLLCGDVGYGKTEVAARAMFKAAAEGKQVAVLVPTTILASQHYYTLKDRFEKFPFSVEMLSRFRSDSEQKKIIDDMKKGRVDVVIGTHRMLSSDIKFKDLGLLVIDEEQRFGVQHKEAIKQLRSNVDVLTLSATPIPRTLHMSLLGIRDMSLIEEPPEARYPVQTYVMEEDDYVIKEAIERELDRGGQVYVIYNRVSGVHRIAEKIEQLVPGRRIAVGHGQMNENALEDVMMSFIEGDVDILVATTIIESGIDIPNVNTAIIIDADKFGLSQLYQLRGRVGRSNRLAYAYLMHKKEKVLSDVAEKRLRAIRDFTEFGAGFKIAMRDLEIRGAGNILGNEQHGHIVNVGYELYCKLVDDAVKALKGEVVSSEPRETTIDVQTSALIPKRYINDEVLKLGMYKKIASIEDEGDQKEIIEELQDRFGDIPRETINLIMVSRIKSLAEALEIKKVVQREDKVMFDYGKKSGIRPVSIFLKRSSHNLAEIQEILNGMYENKYKESSAD